MGPNLSLSERRQAILKIVVEEYVSTARPVGSESVANRYRLGVSAATIRNEMAALEGLGYIRQLHTSAGRVPDEGGYRYFIENLMDEEALSPDEQHMISHQFHQAQLEVSEWLRLCVAVMAQSLQNTAVVTEPRVAQTTLKHIELISIQESLALLVVVLHGGSLQQQMLALPQAYSQDDLRALSLRLTNAFTGMTATQIKDRAGTVLAVDDPFAPPPHLLENMALSTVLKMMHGMDAQAAGLVYHDGLTHMLAQPEFSTVVVTRARHQQPMGRIVELIDLLQQGGDFNSMLHSIAHDDGVQVIIGGLGLPEEMQQYSIVVSRYGVSGAASGVLGVLGPTRMRYARAIAVVKFMAQILTGLSQDLYRSPS